MSANVTFDPFEIPLASDSVPILVYRYNPGWPAGERFQSLPNVFCRRIEYREGPVPPVAYFEYVFDDSDPSSPFPTQFDQVFPLTSQGRWVVRNDDRLCVFGVTAAGVRRLIFDGFAEIPEVALSKDGQSVTFTAAGTPMRCWDTPIGGAIMRQGDKPNDQTDDVAVVTELPTRFNPDRKPNCTPDGKDLGDADTGAPMFLDPLIQRSPDPRTYWTVGKAVRYLLRFWNRQDDDVWIKNYSFAGLDNFLKARTPKSGEFYDPSDPATYTARDVIVRDYDATNKAWPDAVAELCSYAGASFRFTLSQDESDEPVWRILIYRKDASSVFAPVDLLLEESGGPIDPGANNLGAFAVSRDSSKLINAIQIETDPIQLEVSIVLAPGYEPAAGDESDSNRKKYLLSSLSAGTSSDRKKYREYVADEAGDGHYDAPSSSWKTGEGLDLSSILGEDDPETGPNYVKRNRPADGTLITKDSLGRARRAVLHMSRDYAGTFPAVWDGTGHWQPIPSGWELLKDRFGIRVTVEDPEAWDIGKYTGANAQNSGRTMRGITSQANPTPSEQNTKRFVLMLTAVIDSDLMLAARALARQASPSRFIRERRIECNDHFKQRIVTKKSWYNQTSETINSQDDTDKAVAHAEAERASLEFPPVVGTATIPWLTNSYKIGARVRRIVGRDIELQTNAGTSSGEGPRYPFIVGVDYDFSGNKQATVIHYNDQAVRSSQGMRDA